MLSPFNSFPNDVEIEEPETDVSQWEKMILEGSTVTNDTMPEIIATENTDFQRWTNYIATVVLDAVTETVFKKPLKID